MIFFFIVAASVYYFNKMVTEYVIVLIHKDHIMAEETDKTRVVKQMQPKNRMYGKLTNSLE